MSRGQRRVFESHARQIEQDDRFVNGVLTAVSCENLLHYDVEPNASSDIMIVSDIDLPSKPSSKYIVTSHSLQPESSAQSSPTPDSILCTAHALLETCCHMKAKLHILTIAYPGAWEVLFYVELCNVLHTLLNMGLILYITRPAECRHNTICLVIFPFGMSWWSNGLLDIFTNRAAHVGLGTPSRVVFCSFYCSGCWKPQLLGRSLASFC